MLSFPDISRTSRVLFLLLLCSFMMCPNNRVNAWRYRTSKMPVRYILSRVCLRLSQFSQLSFMQYMGLCWFGLPIYIIMIVRIRALYLIIINKSEVWLIWHYFGLGHENGKRCVYIFLCSYHHDYAMLFESVELIKCLQVHSVECVSKVRFILYITCYATYEAVCHQLTHFSSDDCGNIGILSYLILSVRKFYS